MRKTEFNRWGDRLEGFCLTKISAFLVIADYGARFEPCLRRGDLGYAIRLLETECCWMCENAYETATDTYYLELFYVEFDEFRFNR